MAPAISTGTVAAPGRRSGGRGEGGGEIDLVWPGSAYQALSTPKMLLHKVDLDSSVLGFRLPEARLDGREGSAIMGGFNLFGLKTG